MSAATFPWVGLQADALTGANPVGLKPDPQGKWGIDAASPWVGLQADAFAGVDLVGLKPDTFRAPTPEGEACRCS